MIFNSFEFVCFILILWPLYWLGRGSQWRQP